jgi:hypothetical protein
MATSFALGARSFVRPSIHKVLGPSLSYPTPSKHPGRGGSHSGLFVRTGLPCGTLRRLSHIGEGPLGGIGNISPSSSDIIPMGSKRFALQGIEYTFL